ncbi:MAG: hypothetical protein KGH98_04460 [Candidatus Micrarchaeota archaeon]|nr:hypothetical protein [Candidatus Micrarchaeota archaeon]
MALARREAEEKAKGLSAAVTKMLRAELGNLISPEPPRVVFDPGMKVGSSSSNWSTNTIRLDQEFYSKNVMALDRTVPVEVCVIAYKSFLGPRGLLKTPAFNDPLFPVEDMGRRNTFVSCKEFSFPLFGEAVFNANRIANGNRKIRDVKLLIRLIESAGMRIEDASQSVLSMYKHIKYGTDIGLRTNLREGADEGIINSAMASTLASTVAVLTLIAYSMDTDRAMRALFDDPRAVLSRIASTEEAQMIACVRRGFLRIFS